MFPLKIDISKFHVGFSRNGPYELQAVGEKESPVQKLNRLKCEVIELQQEIENTVFGFINNFKDI